AGLRVESILESDAETVGLRPEAIRSLDIAMFEACTDDLLTHAEEAVALYAGDLAEGLGHDCFAAGRERLPHARRARPQNASASPTGTRTRSRSSLASDSPMATRIVRGAPRSA